MTTTPHPLPPDLADQTVDPWLEDSARSANPAPAGAPYISVFDVLMMLARRRRTILGSTLLFGLLALLYTFLSPPQYESTVTILPPAQMSTRGVGGSIQDLSTALSAAEGFTFKSAEDFWTSVLKGRTISDRVIQSQGLMQVYHVKLLSKAEEALKRHTTFDIDKAGLISIIVKDTNPQRAANIANAYIDSMHQTMGDMAQADAEQRKQFFDQQVEEERENMKKAEDDQLQVERKTGVIALGGQTEQAIREIGDLRARITERKVELEAMHAVATDENPDVQKLRTEIAADEAALAQAESQQGRTKVGDIAASDVPQATLDYITAAREVRYHESLYEALGKQVEAAKMDAARSAPMIQVVDKAVPSDHTADLARGWIILLGLLFGFLLGIPIGAAQHFYENLANSPEGRQKLQQLAQTLQGRA